MGSKYSEKLVTKYTEPPSKGSCMGPEYGPLPPLKGSDVWALNLYRVYEGYVRGTL